MFLFLQLPQNLRQDTGANREGGANAENGVVTAVTKGVFHFMKQRKEFSGVDGQLSAFGGDEKPLIQPFKKQYVIFLFHFSYGAADGGLGDVKLFGGFAHAACFGYGKKNFQMS